MPAPQSLRNLWALVSGALSVNAMLNLYNSNSTFNGSSLSTPCISALTSPINCDPSVQILSNTDFGVTSFLTGICTANCSQSLSSYRSAILSACTSSDFLLVSDTKYPPTYPADYTTYYFNATCLTSGSSFCTDNLGEFYNISTANAAVELYSELPETMVCDPCFLQSGQLQLQSPIAHNPDLANNWTSILSRCNAPTFTFTPPSSTLAAPVQYQTLAVNGTRSNNTICVFGSYTVKSGDTCSSISASQNVVSDQFIALNGLDQGCTTLSSQVGKSLCLPQACDIYTIQANDTCTSIGLAHNLTFAQVVSLNFQLDPACKKVIDKVGAGICVGLINYRGAPIPTEFPQTTATTIAPPPTDVPTAPNTTLSTCGEWHVVVGGDTCNQLSINYGLSLTDLYFLNPMLDANCSNLFLNFSYCVEGFNVTYPDATGTGVVGPASWPAPTNVTVVEPDLAPGTFDNCSTYWTETQGTSCEDISTLFNVTQQILQFWNPSLSPNCDANLVANAIYCVADGPLFTGPIIVPPPSNVAAGTITAGCANYYTVVSGDSCSTIEMKFNLTLAQFIVMNPEINTGCTNLELDEAYCVQTSNSTSGPAPPSNVAPGTITDGCSEYYTVLSGDSCTVIESKFNLTLSLFITMNPEINAGCTNLALAEAYCVQTSNSTTGLPPPSNLAPGTITAGCSDYYTVVSGDSCSVIETKFNLTLAEFIVMNPEINSGCTNLALAEAYCVQTSNTTTTPTGPPPNLASGSLSNCTTYHTVVSGDTCAIMETSADIAASDFFRWNSEVNAACTNIFAGEAYCVGGGGAACKKTYTVKSGDSCSAIVSSQGVTQAALNALNPQLDSACDNLVVGENLCVG